MRFGPAGQVIGAEGGGLVSEGTEGYGGSDKAESVGSKRRRAARRGKSFTVKRRGVHKQSSSIISRRRVRGGPHRLGSY